MTAPDSLAPSPAAELTYDSYLQLPALLDLQRPLGGSQHELRFIVVHQATELHFALIVHDLRRLVPLLDAGELPAAAELLDGVTTGLDAVLAQLHTLRALPPKAFREDIRPHLGTASGLQSRQFRLVELLAGRREEAYLRQLHAIHGTPLPEELRAAADERSVTAAYQDAARRADRGDDAHPGRPPGTWLVRVHTRLLEVDQRWLAWRAAHVAVARRMLGHDEPGTGGTAPDYLARTRTSRLFPHLPSPAAAGPAPQDTPRAHAV